MPSTAAAYRRASTRTSCSTRGGGRSSASSLVRGRPHRGGRAAPDAVDGRGLPRRGRLGAAQAVQSMTMVYSSRILIERVLRDKVRDSATSSSARGSPCAASRRPTAAAGRAGHRSRLLDAPQERRATIDADLVVDALGRGSSCPTGWRRWLARDRRCRRSTPRSPTPRGGTRPARTRRPPESWWWQHIVVMPTQDKGEHPPEHELPGQLLPDRG